MDADAPMLPLVRHTPGRLGRLTRVTQALGLVMCLQVSGCMTTGTQDIPTAAGPLSTDQ